MIFIPLYFHNLTMINNLNLILLLKIEIKKYDKILQKNLNK